MGVRSRLFLALTALTAASACHNRESCEEAVNHMYGILEADASERMARLTPDGKDKIAAGLAAHRAALAKDRAVALGRCASSSMSRENHDCLMQATTVDESIQCGGFK